MKVAVAMIAAFCIGAPISAAAPPSSPPPVPALVRVNGKLLRPRGTCEFKDLIRFESKRGQLCVDTAPTAAVQNMVVGHSVVLSIDRSSDPWLVIAHPVVTNGGSNWLLRATAQRQSEDKKPLGPISINSTPGTFALIGEGWQDEQVVRVEF